MGVILGAAPASGAKRTFCAGASAPQWARALLGAEPESASHQAGGLEVSVLEGKGRALVSAAVPGVLSLSQRAFEEATAAAYEALRRELSALVPRHPLRLWNFIPGLLEPLGDLPHRYMAFNAGRYRSYSRWFEHVPDFSRRIPTATGVGHEGGELVVQCLSCTCPGTAVENPRQISSYRYSQRFGPLPPCFARATKIGNGGRAGASSWLLVGGTASVLGEDSVHLSDLGAQARETFLNLAAVAAAGSNGNGNGRPAGTGDPHGRYRHLRVYHVRPGDLPALRGLVEGTFRALESVEYCRADLCRPELLVEIEGVAELGPGRSEPA